MCVLFSHAHGLQVTLDAKMVGPEKNDSARTAPGKDDPTVEKLTVDYLTASGSVHRANSSRPNVILGIGFPKCGSTFIFHVLSKMPNVVTGVRKELNYFEWPANSPNGACDNLLDGVKRTPAEHYVRACFGDAEKTRGKYLLESSPGYATLRGPLLHYMMRRLRAVAVGVNLRMIAVVREPTQRVVSELNMFRDRGRLNGTDGELSMAVQKELSNDEHYKESYHVASSEYARHLDFWLKRFPPENLLVVNYVALNDVATWHRILKHCGLEIPSDNRLQNILSRVSKNGRQNRPDYLKISPQAQAELTAHYTGHNEQLWKMLGTAAWW